MTCTNDKLVALRDTFINELRLINGSFHLLNAKQIFQYTMTAKDKSIMNCISKYYEIITNYDNII